MAADAVQAVVEVLRGAGIAAYGGVVLPDSVAKHPDPAGVVLVTAAGGFPARSDVKLDATNVVVKSFGRTYQTATQLYGNVWDVLYGVRRRDTGGGTIVSITRAGGVIMLYDEALGWRYVSGLWKVELVP